MFNWTPSRTLTAQEVETAEELVSRSKAIHNNLELLGVGSQLNNVAALLYSSFNSVAANDLNPDEAYIHPLSLDYFTALMMLANDVNVFTQSLIDEGVLPSDSTFGNTQAIVPIQNAHSFIVITLSELREYA